MRACVVFLYNIKQTCTNSRKSVSFNVYFFCCHLPDTGLYVLVIQFVIVDLQVMYCVSLPCATYN